MFLIRWFIPILLTSPGWGPLAARHYEVVWAEKLFREHWLDTLIASALLTPILGIAYPSFRKAPSRVRIILGLFSIMFVFALNFTLGRYLVILIGGASSDWKRATDVFHSVTDYYNYKK